VPRKDLEARRQYNARGEKVANLSRLRNGRATWDKIVAEIAKCDVVCANCHRERTRRRSQGLEVDAPVPLELPEGWVSAIIRFPAH
jgi:hypothetical protein